MLIIIVAILIINEIWSTPQAGWYSVLSLINQGKSGTKVEMGYGPLFIPDSEVDGLNLQLKLCTNFMMEKFLHLIC